jgi:hypothetical protein
MSGLTNIAQAKNANSRLSSFMSPVRVTRDDSRANSRDVQLSELDSALRVTVSCRVVDRGQYLNEGGAYAASLHHTFGSLARRRWRFGVAQLFYDVP